jgi:ATPase subunit of ABC transporter with duplicated ATPase domains
VVNSVFAVEHSSIKAYLGNYSDYEAKRQPGALRQKEPSAEKKQAYESFKQKSREKSRYKKKLQQLTEDIADAERRLEELDNQRNSIDASDWEGLAAIEKEKSELESSFLQLYATKEEIEKSPPA